MHPFSCFYLVIHDFTWANVSVKADTNYLPMFFGLQDKQFPQVWRRYYKDHGDLIRAKAEQVERLAKQAEGAVEKAQKEEKRCKERQEAWVT